MFNFTLFRLLFISYLDDSLTAVLVLHDIIAGIWMFGCVQWKILIPFWNYEAETCPKVYEGPLSELSKLNMNVKRQQE